MASEPHPVALAALRTDLLPVLDEARAALDRPDLDAALDRLGALAALATRSRVAVAAAATGQELPAVSRTARAGAAYLAAHARAGATVAACADACAVTPRALQAAFRRHLGTTPSAYLRAVRLDGARAELAAAAPGETTVCAIAARWGWADPDRFTAAYRAAHGETPSATLRSPAGQASTATTPTPGPAARPGRTAGTAPAGRTAPRP
jgi:transcriptional regulator GlxA family with amidase domain